MIWVLLTVFLGVQTPSRDIPSPARIGTGIIAGTILTDDAEARPIRRVVVTLTAGGIPMPRSAQTDDAGRFTFVGIPSGNYTLQASRVGYVTTYYGSKKPGRGPGIPVSIADGQRVEDVTLKMLRGAVITGVVRLPGGKPVADLNVRASMATLVNGQRQIDSIKSATTDDRGEYRLYGLAPGEYVVQASLPSTGNDMRRITSAEISAAEAALRATGPETAPPAPGPNVNFATVYYPGTARASGAQTILVAAGQERAGVDMTLEFVQTAKVSGTVLSPDGRPVSLVRLSLSLKSGNDIEAYYGNYYGVAARPDASFSTAGVSPGRYVLTARAAPAGDVPAPPTGPPSGVPIPGAGVPAPALTLWASAELDVDGQDVSGLTLRLQPGMTVSGRFVYDSTVPPLPDPSRTRFSLEAVTTPGAPAQTASFLAIGASSMQLEKDGTFSVKGVAPGPYRMVVSPIGPVLEPMPGVRSWTVKSVMIGGRDVADLPIQIKPGEDVTDVVVTMTDQQTEVSGTVLDNLNRPTAGFPIVVFATDRAYWPAGNARVRKIQPASNGKFTILGLPAGEYYVCAVTDVEANDLRDPAFLESLAASSFKITLRPGEKRPLDLKLGGGF